MSISNKFLAIGRLTREPELKYTPDGTAVCSFSIAVNRPFAKGDHPEADFFNCVAWRGTGETISKFFTKGSKIGIEGRIQTRTFKDKDGVERKVFEVIVEDFDFVESKKESDSNPPERKASSTKTAAPIESDEGDLPF